MTVFKRLPHFIFLLCAATTVIVKQNSKTQIHECVQHEHTGKNITEMPYSTYEEIDRLLAVISTNLSFSLFAVSAISD